MKFFYRFMKTFSKNKRRIAMVLCFALTAAMVSACGKSSKYSTETNIIDDKYRNFYEIFVYSFCDSDGDGYGDLKGVTSKLDYIKDMGFNGIWLMPINPSPSYHKYDVTDYYSVDELYGSLDDFRELLDEAHERDIHIIMDLVINHTSNKHPWFIDACKNEDSEYREYYNFTDTAQKGYTSTGKHYYESRFTSTMPDLNLDSEKVKAEIENIVKYWLDFGVDGFRLDAVTSYYTDRTTKNIEFLGWLDGIIEKYSPDAYVVGECWEGEAVISQYYDSGIDSFFCFPASQKTGFTAQLVLGYKSEPGLAFEKNLLTLQKKYGVKGITAAFLDNHDTDRMATSFKGDADKIKFAAGLLAMMDGSIFVYYGDEIGMTGGENDPNRRISMYWNDSTAKTNTPPDATVCSYTFGGVDEQQKDPDSILNYYKQALLLRNQNPEIARGTVESIAHENPMISMFKKTYNGESIIVIVNFSEESEEVVVSTGETGVSKVVGELNVSGESAYKITNDSINLTVPSKGIVVLR